MSIPGGRAQVGSDDPDHPEEWPVREVVLAPYRIAACAVTNAEFADFVAATGHRTDAERFGSSFVFAGFLPDDFPPTRGVAAAPWWREVPGATWAHPFGPQSDLRDSTTTRSSTSRGTTPRRTPRGAAPGCRPRTSGSTPRAAAWWGSRSPGAPSSSPAASTG